MHVGEVLLHYYQLHAVFDSINALAFQTAPCLVNVSFFESDFEFPNHVLEVKLASLNSSLTLDSCKHDQRYSAK